MRRRGAASPHILVLSSPAQKPSPNHPPPPLVPTPPRPLPQIVLGAAMWNNPHILVLDEPTNYLDRDSLGALAEAIKAYGGGVVMITHNQEFYSALTQVRAAPGGVGVRGGWWGVRGLGGWVGGCACVLFRMRWCVGQG